MSIVNDLLNNQPIIYMGQNISTEMLLYNVNVILTNFLYIWFAFIGSRPSMAEKILRRTSYGGEQTESQKGNIGVYAISNSNMYSNFILSSKQKYI